MPRTLELDNLAVAGCGTQYSKQRGSVALSTGIYADGVWTFHFGARTTFEQWNSVVGDFGPYAHYLPSELVPIDIVPPLTASDSYTNTEQITAFKATIL